MSLWHYLPACLVALLLAACDDRRQAGSAPSLEEVRGTAITPASGTSSVNSATAAIRAAASAPDIIEDGYIKLGFHKLSSFKYELYEVLSESGGRPLLKSDDVIPPEVKAYDGKRTAVRGFVLPLRIKKQKVIEFLLLRDQGTCCFGPQAQINHFIRVRYPAGAEFELGRVYEARGVIHVGEVYVQGYLTGIYHFDATEVRLAEN